MKIKSTLFTVAIGVALASCGGNAESNDATPKTDDQKTEVKKEEPKKVEGTKYTVDVNASSVQWEGSKATYAHNGVVKLKSGELIISEDKLVGGSFTIDMNSIVNSDVEDAEKNADLVKHLKSGDFFDAANFPTAKFEVTSATEMDVTGNLTIKDVTKEVTISGASVTVLGDIVIAAGDLTIDRTEFGVVHKSGSKIKDLAAEAIISDEVSFKISVTANK